MYRCSNIVFGLNNIFMSNNNPHKLPHQRDTRAKPSSCISRRIPVHQHDKSQPPPAMSQESHTPPTRTGPITILDSDTAKLYTHIHPVLILALYTYKFRSIVADPVPALSQTLVGLSVLQIAFAAICLPPTSGDGSVDGGRGKSGEKSGGKVLGKKKRVGAAGKTEVEFWKAMVRLFSLDPVIVDSNCQLRLYHHRIEGWGA